MGWKWFPRVCTLNWRKAAGVNICQLFIVYWIGCQFVRRLWFVVQKPRTSVTEYMRMKCMHSIILLIRSSNHKIHNHLSPLWKLKRLNWISQCTIYILPDLNCIWICFERLQLTEEFFCNKKNVFYPNTLCFITVEWNNFQFEAQTLFLTGRHTGQENQ